MIPERGDVPGHCHYGARYVVHAGIDEHYVVPEASLDRAWCDITTTASDMKLAGDDHRYDSALRWMARKWLQRAESRGQ